MNVIDQLLSQEYALYHGDCVQVLQGLPDSSVHFSIYSPPFQSIYSYSDAVEDLSNVRTPEEFFANMDYMAREMVRVLIPGRLMAFHCMNLPCTLERHGYIGLYDFRGELIRAWQSHGMIYHSEVLIWKDPLSAATRTHALGLAHKQIVTDSAMCRQGLGDYLVVMRKPGKNLEPVKHGGYWTTGDWRGNGFQRYIGAEPEPLYEKTPDARTNKYSHYVWQRYASPVWFDIDPSDTLQKQSARDEDDSRHICPLQLTVIRRAIELWSNPHDIVLDPFCGIGSSGYVALEEGRRFIGSELKHTYWNQSVKNLANVIGLRSQLSLCDGSRGPSHGSPLVPPSNGMIDKA